MRRFFFTALVLTGLVVGLYPKLAWAGGDEGHMGGDGIRLNGNVYLYDLVEAGVEGNPQYDLSMSHRPRFAELKAKLTPRLGALADENVIHYVAIKLMEIGRRNQLFALALLETLRSYQWALVEPPLVDIPDGDSILDTTNLEVVQLAARYNRAVRIQKALWLELTVEHRAALVFHEIIYALIKPYGIERQEQNIRQVRLITGYLFSPDFTGDHGDFLAAMLGQDFPNIRQVWLLDDNRFAIRTRFEFKHVPLQSVLEDGRGHLFSRDHALPDPKEETAFLCSRIKDWRILNPAYDVIRLNANFVGMTLQFNQYVNPKDVVLSYIQWSPSAERVDKTLSEDVPRDEACEANARGLVRSYYEERLKVHVFDP